jgi:hypothetical protein
MGKKKGREYYSSKDWHNIIEDWEDSEENESSVVELRRMMIKMFNELKEDLKEDIQNQLNEYQKKSDKT